MQKIQTGQDMWDTRYSSNDYAYGKEPNEFLAQHYSKIRGSKVLCLAEGEGRNAVFLASKGYDVTAVDLSAVGLEKAKKLAVEKQVALTCIQADLATFQLGENQWDGIVSIFCHLPEDARHHLHQQMSSALKRGGVLLLEAYSPRQLAFGTGGPQDERMMLTVERLTNEITDLEFEHLQELERKVVEGTYHTGHASVVQAIATKTLRTYQVSSNRETGIHKMRFIESSGGETDPNCRVCQPTPKPRGED